MAVLRESHGPVSGEVLDQAWQSDPIQRARALDGLVADGLVELAVSLTGLTAGYKALETYIEEARAAAAAAAADAPAN